MFKIFWSGVLPLAALYCLWLAVLCLYRGGRMLVQRGRAICTGLHASGVVLRHGAYVPVFSYICASGKEVDILGNQEYATESAALRARRPLVYERERPDAGVARSAGAYMARPLALLLVSALLAVASHYLLSLMPD